MQRDRELIIEQFIRVYGPAFPAQIAKRIGSDSWVASALLNNLVKLGKLKATHRTIGSSKLFFLPGQEEDARKLLTQYLNEREKELLERIGRKGYVLEGELEEGEKALLNDLLDFVEPVRIMEGGKEFLCWKHYLLSSEELRQRLSAIAEPKPAMEVSFSAKVEEFLAKVGARILFEDKGGKIVSIPPLDQRYLIKLKQKRRIDERDITLAYAEVQAKKMPCIVLTNGKLTKRAEELLKSLGEFVKIKRL